MRTETENARSVPPFGTREQAIISQEQPAPDAGSSFDLPKTEGGKTSELLSRSSPLTRRNTCRLTVLLVNNNH
jgi:hypothetical protein